MSKSNIFVFSGASGAGKSTLLNRMMEKYPGRFAFSVSHTTRQRRPGEVDGKDYHFVQRDAMLADIEAGKFLESAEFAGNVYGTSKAAIDTVLQSGRLCLLDVELQGVQSIHAVKPSLNAHYLLIRPPSLEAVEKRLRLRGTENEETLRKRLDRAKTDLDFIESPVGNQLFDVVIVNDDLDTAYGELDAYVKQFV